MSSLGKRTRAPWLLAIGVSVMACTAGGHDDGQSGKGGSKANGTAGSDAGVSYGGGGNGAAANGGGGDGVAANGGGGNGATGHGTAGVNAGGGRGSDTGSHNSPARAHVTFQLMGVM
jgi:hypothetical protein